MNITHRGTKKEDLWYEKTCATCTTKFEFQASEAQKSASGTLTVLCPVCSESSSVAITNGRAMQPSKVSNSYWDR